MISSDKAFKLFSVVTLILVGVAIYSNIFSGAFHFDDNSFIVSNLAIRNPADLSGIWKYWPSRFMTFLSFALNYRIHQLSVAGFHITNLVIHLFSSILVFWMIILTCLTPEVRKDDISKRSAILALGGALLFLSHPVQTEAVTYIFQRGTCLAAFFYILSLCLYIKSRLLQIKSGSRSPWRWFYFSSLIAGLLAMFTKENAITLPLIIILCEACFFNSRKFWAYKYAAAFLILLPIIPLVILFTKPPVTKDMQLLYQHTTTGGYYFLTQLRVMMTYIRLLFIPINQNLDYDYSISKTILEPYVVMSIAGLSGMLFVALKLFSRYRIIAFSIFWFFVTLIPESTMIPLSDLIFEHRLYLPMVGFSFFVPAVFYYFLRGKNLFYAVTLLILCVICCSILTYKRNSVWKDGISLWSDTIRKSAHKPRPYNNRALAYVSLGKYSEAIDDFSQAIRLNPFYPITYKNRGVAYFYNSNFNAAILDFSKAIKLKPDYCEAYYSRANVYALKGDFGRALDDYNQAIVLNPKSAEAFYNKGNAYLDKLDVKQAIFDFKKALDLDPKFLDAYINLGFIYFNNKEYNQSIFNCDQAIKIDPFCIKAYYIRGRNYFAKGNSGQALLDHKMVIQLDPSHAEAYLGIGFIYYSSGQNQQAIGYLERARAIFKKKNDFKNTRIAEEYLKRIN